ncbi:5'-nucleotidase C-terminal domain-containing protein [Halobacillus karajensis]|uniref:Trifunctional nucleotide phosphoesterase protein YfkN n=1 Tax=Halobacillus karajensis TaxID=195088 RepID=A0A059NYD6_9BACI|nr:5'-nucleotidase C-terminal domain-containing protein [Halobacillus karajensis]CDQ18930.1 Trifunctional nucleotide phosphoesterase protein YfkN precursor [Halobacillus karajensis]CDQ22997.1 Trifunctional nucleotide phosphoesterase protein YfkN precursor [Halobacillus karajensis]CDQ26479.1 Trifunctional nucleotide phosphoesterase protein YfkN precursor [Halobacillus karajensis]
MKNLKKHKGKISLTAAGAAMLAASLTPAATVSADHTFPDIPEDHMYHETIHDLYEAGVVNGYDDGTFSPADPVTRAQAAKMMAKILDLDTAPSGSYFSDVPEEAWYAGSVYALHEAGYIDGVGNGKFAPDKEITRAEFAELIVDAYEIERKEVDHPFEDVEEGSWYESAVETLYGHGLISGLSETEFGSKHKIKRGDFAWLLATTDYKFGNKLPKPDEDHFELSLMHTNDTHGHLDDIARRVTAVEEVREENPEALLLDAGDVFSGTLYFNEFKGQADLEFMNRMEYDLMTFGNHEFDLGSSPEGHKALADFVNHAEFPFVSSNVDFSQDENMAGLYKKYVSKLPSDGMAYNSIIKKVDGEEVGFFGLTTEETADISSPEDITFENYIETAEDRVAALEELGVDKIVALTHIGYDDNPAYDNDQMLAEVDGIDIIVGGHSHTALDEPVEITTDENGDPKDPTIVVQADQYGNYLGTLDVEFDEDGVVVGYAGELIDVSEKEEDPETAEILEGYAKQVEEVREEESGGVAAEAFPNPRGSEEDPSSVRNSETALGNLITDGMLAKAQEFNSETLAAFQNAGGIRTSIDEGPITIGEILQVMPFGNTLATIELSGAEVKQALEHSVSNAPDESGGFLQVAGLNYTYDSSEAVGERVKGVTIQQDGEWVTLAEDETYTIATNAFTAKGGDGYEVFAQAYEEGRVTDLGLSDWEVFRDYVAEKGTVEPVIEDRIQDVAGE